MAGVCGVAALPAAGVRGGEIERRTIPEKWIAPLLPEDLPTLKFPAYYGPLDKARAQAFAGRYKRSLITLREVGQGDPAEVAMIRGQALAATGQLDEALAALSDAAVADKPAIQVERARVLGKMGKLAEGIALLHQHLRQHPDSIAGHYYLGQLCERIGDIAAAKAAYGWFDAEGQKFLDKWKGQGADAFNNDAATVVLVGRAYDRLSTLMGAYQNNRGLHDTILGLFVKAYDVIDRGYWPAHVAAAEYFISHDNDAEAVKELMAAAEANPNDEQTLDQLGRMAVRSYNFDGADKAVMAMRDVNPASVAADLLECRNLIQQRRPKDAAGVVQRVLARQPENLEALGLLAATSALQLQDEQTASILKQVDKLDPDNASAYLEVAEALGAMRQYPRSAAMYKIAIARAPWWTEAQNGLGLLYTQSGDEDAARVTLDAAHALDPFNVSATNYLRLLDEMSLMATKESAHFIVMYDAKLDPMVPEYFNDYMESVYQKVCGDFHCQPPVKTYIEVFPTHDAFSVRTTGSPWIGTVGASTGRVIALVAPRKGQATMGSYNWSQVLRHEFTHTVTLAATDNRIAHWFTEGLAVYEEHAPIPWDWVPMLYNAVTKKQLFTMENLTWGFVRPKRPIDRQLAYAQSFWICKYIEQTYGHEAILKLLAEFRNGASQEDAFKKILDRDLGQFGADFTKWAEKQVDGWGYDPETSKKYAQLRGQGEALIASRQYAAAADVWRQIAQLRPVDALPHQRLAGLYLTPAVHQPDKAIEQLKILDKVELKDNRYAKRIAGLLRDEKHFDEATTYALRAVYMDPYDLHAHELLAGLYEQTNNAAGLAKEQRVIPILSQWINDHLRHPEGEE
jgi:predicted Zn-dependent protease